MPGSSTSLFDEPEDFQTALQADGIVGLVITGRGRFRARLTRIDLSRLCLAALQEELASIAFVVIPADILSVLLPLGEGTSPVWGGLEARAGEIITFGPGERLHAVTAGPASWGVIQIAAEELIHYAEAFVGTPVRVPSGARWRLPLALARRLTALHRAAIRMAERRSGTLADIETAHGLEQQLIHTLIECLANGPTTEEAPTARRRRWAVAGFEELIRSEPPPRIDQICARLGVSERFLRACCQKYLRISPSRYFRLARMQQVRRALIDQDPDTAKVAEIAARYGFRDAGRFATNYRALYGELPSATLRRTKQALAEASLPRIA